MKRSKSGILAGEISLLSLSVAPMRRSLEGMERLLTDAEEEYVRIKDEEGYSDKFASHFAWVAQKVSGLMAEARKLEAQHRRYGEQMTQEQLDEAIIEHILDAPPERLRRFVDAINEADSDEGPPLLG